MSLESLSRFLSLGNVVSPVHLKGLQGKTPRVTGANLEGKKERGISPRKAAGQVTSDQVEPVGNVGIGL